jgi:valyl-tRNA synthetase
MSTYKLVWDDFCAWYLEIVKPDFVDGQSLPIDNFTYNSTIEFLEDLLKLMHPFMPFITEEIWHLVNEREEKDCIIVSAWPEIIKSDEKILTRFSTFQETVVGIRTIRNERNISPKDSLELVIRIEENPVSKSFEPLIKKLCNISAVRYTKDKIENAASFIIENVEFFIPLSGIIDADAEREKLKKEIDYNKGFLKSVMSKLSNEKFVSNAKPEIIANEEKKKIDAEAKLKVLEEQLNGL